MLASPILMASAQQPYLGEYLSLTPTTTTKAIFRMDFQDLNPANIPAGSYLASFLSASGGTSSAHSSQSGWMYQNGFGAVTDGTVSWVPQAWYANGDGDPEWSYQTSVGTDNYPMYFGKMTMDTANTRIIYKAYVYEDTQDIERDTPTVSTQYETVTTGDTVFLVGNRSSGGQAYRYLQAGIESDAVITNAWKIQNICFSYWTGSAWHYEAGYSVRGNIAYISAEGGDDDEWIMGGGATYTNCDKYSSINDIVIWYHGSSTYADNTQLWSGTGAPDTTVSYPYS